MSRPYIITVSSEKGGVGKTTLATNLAVYLKSLAREIPVTLFSFDNHFTVDRMFRFSSTQPELHIGHLFTGAPASKLLQQGQYGVRIISSCDNLQQFVPQMPADDALAKILSSSKLAGIVIIDTCPILDPYTRNALFAADRVIVPVKDAPSLENCQHLANFYQDHGIKHSPLKLLPCLIDTRIRYKGPFTTSYQLLKAYAINRGYRCFEGFIAKSPKVESLATNPEGKVYPVLTQGRGTDVHLQFKHLARQVYLKYLEKGPGRIAEYSEINKNIAQSRDKRQSQRLLRVGRQCLCCGKELDIHRLKNAFYTETTDREVCGFIEEDCFFNMVFNNLYGDHKSTTSAAVKELFRESAANSYFLLKRHQERQIQFIRLDPQGETLSQQLREIKPARNLLRRPVLHLQNLITGALPEGGKGSLLLIKQQKQFAGEILSEALYAQFQMVFSRARMDYQSAEESNSRTLYNPVFP